MNVASPVKIPSYCHHKKSGQAVVRLAGKDHYLGKYGSAASIREYDRLRAEFLVGGHRTASVADSAGLTVMEVAAAYWKHQKAYHGWGKNRGDSYCLKDALRIIKRLYGDTLTADFGPLRLKACRQDMLGLDWSRGYINRQVDRIRRMFKWAASEEMLPADIFVQLATVEGLAKGKTTARETKKVKPVAVETVDATLPYMPPVVAAMVRLQLQTGSRPAEICVLRPADIDMKNPGCWIYRPAHHKTEHHDQDRLIFIGPKAQEILKPYLGTKLDGYCFSPSRSEADRNTKRRLDRKSPMTPSQAKRKPKRRRNRAPGDRYDTNGYRRAIKRACDKADDQAHADNPQLAADVRLVPSWAPNMLRHTRATELRRHGLDVTKTILGHNKVETTQIYAEKDIAAAMELVAKIG